MSIKISNPVVKLLEARGLLPKHCRLLEIHIPPNEAMVIRYEVFISDDTAAFLAEAFAEVAAGERAKNKLVE